MLFRSGAQLIVEALGGSVVEGEWVRGWRRMATDVRNTIFGGRQRVTQFQFHRNHIVRLPVGGITIASSSRDPTEAFMVGSRIIGVGYHPEITSSDAARIYTLAGLTGDDLEGIEYQAPSREAFQASLAFFSALFS